MKAPKGNDETELGRYEIGPNNIGRITIKPKKMAGKENAKIDFNKFKIFALKPSRFKTNKVVYISTIKYIITFAKKASSITKDKTIKKAETR